MGSVHYFRHRHSAVRREESFRRFTYTLLHYTPHILIFKPFIAFYAKTLMSRVLIALEALVLVLKAI